MIHLGMSGETLRISDPDTPWRKHDHVVLQLGLRQAAAFPRSAPLRLRAAH